MRGRAVRYLGAFRVDRGNRVGQGAGAGSRADTTRVGGQRMECPACAHQEDERGEGTLEVEGVEDGLDLPGPVRGRGDAWRGQGGSASRPEDSKITKKNGELILTASWLRRNLVLTSEDRRAALTRVRSSAATSALSSLVEQRR